MATMEKVKNETLLHIESRDGRSHLLVVTENKPKGTYGLDTALMCWFYPADTTLEVIG